jgi:hypothetical protein
MLTTGDMIAVMIALLSVLIVLGMAMKQNARLAKDNTNLRRIVNAYRQQVNLKERV